MGREGVLDLTEYAQRVHLSCFWFTRNNSVAHVSKEGTEQSQKCSDGTWSLKTTGSCVIMGQLLIFHLKNHSLRAEDLQDKHK